MSKSVVERWPLRFHEVFPTLGCIRCKPKDALHYDGHGARSARTSTWTLLANPISSS